MYNYFEFFEKVLTKVLKTFIKQNVFVVELRHIFGMVINDEGKPIGVEEEIKIFQRVFAHVQNEYPLFRATVINSGLKIVGKPHIDFEIAATIRS